MGRFIKENRAPQITVLVVGAVVVYLLPLCFCLIVTASYHYDICPIRKTSMLTCAMVNSLVNPLNYCWRQKEMRKVISKVRTQAVPPDIQWTRIRCASEKIGNYRSNFCFSLSKALFSSSMLIIFVLFCFFSNNLVFFLMESFESSHHSPRSTSGS